ncbi:alpha-mannosidase, partial [Listeria monocytogenes]|nr:alpha-mannosidase [Listeria monocytogenes]
EITAEFHLFLTDDSDVANSSIPAQVNARLTPIFAFQHKSATKEKILAEKRDFAEWKTEAGFVFSAFKLAKDNQPIIRFYQTASEPKLLTTERPWQNSTILEETTGDAKKQFTASPNEIITLKGV